MAVVIRWFQGHRAANRGRSRRPLRARRSAAVKSRSRRRLGSHRRAAPSRASMAWPAPDPCHRENTSLVSGQMRERIPTGSVPLPCQNGRETGASHGLSRRPRNPADLGKCW